MAHESGVGFGDGARQSGGDARLVNPFGTAGYDQDRPVVGDRAENYRFANLRHVAAKGGGGFGRRARAVGQFADGFRSAGGAQQRADMFDPCGLGHGRTSLVHRLSR